MKFVITRRGFIIPLIAGIILLFQNWVPAAKLLCLGLNVLGLAVIALDYFILPEAKAFQFTRILPEQFFLHIKETVRVRISYDISIPLKLQFQDTPPESFACDRKPISCSLPGGFRDAEVSYEVRPQLRGASHFDAIGIRISSPLGLLYRQFKVFRKDRIQVFPRLQTEKEGLQSLFYMSRVESRIQRTYGPGREFAQMREYRRGDDMRAIHWKRSARINKLIVREFEPEKGQNVFIMIDGGRLMNAETGHMSKVDWALSSSIALAREALNRHDAVGIMGFSNRVDTYVLPSNKKPQLTAVVKAVYGFQPGFVEPDYHHVFQWVRANLKNRCIIVLFTDFIDPYLSSEVISYIKLLKRKHRMICCALGHNDIQEIGFRQTDSLAEAMYASVVRESLDNRRQILVDLARNGVDIIDVPPDRVSGAVLTGYARARWG
jgi:uncharacterized protein (DUF58 family)